MIAGLISFESAVPAIPALAHITELNADADLSFHQVSCKGFGGGYFINTRLPYRESDFCFIDEDNDLFVLLSGSVYNREEVSEFSNKSESLSDPGLIASMFLASGPGMVKRLNGDFAIFILQPSKREAYLFRDHLGVRPLAYLKDEQGIYFSSDINGLCRAFSNGQPIDSDYLSGYFKYIDYRKTPNEKVKKLLPGHYLHCSDKGTEVKKYWEPEKIKIDSTLSHSVMLEQLRALLLDAVRIRCDHRFRAGAHVSSGIDSGIVSALVRKENPHQKDFYGFSWSPAEFNHPDVKYDERDLVRELCRHTDILPVFSDIGRSGFHQIVSSFYENHGFFSEDRTIRQAAEVSVNLIFSGWGGDEFISTAASAIEPDLLRSLKLRLFLRRNQARHPKKFIRNLVYCVVMPALGILDKNTSGSFRDDARYLKAPFRKSDRKAVRQFYFHTSRRRHHLGMLDFYHLQDRCERWYLMGYRNGVEYRYPLLDRRIVEYMLKVPSELLCNTDFPRPILREIGEGILPEEVRRNMSKEDPVYWLWMDGLFRDSAVTFMEEVNGWKANGDLHFVDFDLLEEDISMFRENRGTVDSRVLFRALVYLKAIHEFTMTYRNK